MGIGGGVWLVSADDRSARVGVSASYRLSRAWPLLGGLSYTRFGDGIRSSPIVNRTDARTLFAGAWWMF